MRKNIIRISGIILAALFFVGCYSDKGNYEYDKTLGLIDFTIKDIDSDSYSKMYTVGDVMRYTIEAEGVDFSDTRYEIQWYMLTGGYNDPLVKKMEDGWTKKDFEFTVTLDYLLSDQFGYYSIFAEVKDKETGLVSIKELDGFVRIAPKYDSSGFYILTEDASGAAKFSFCQIEGTKSIPDPIYTGRELDSISDFELHYNVYEKENPGKTLKGAPVVMEPFYYISYGGGMGDIQTAIFTTEGLVDVEKAGLTEDVDFADIFEDGKFPDGVEYFTGGQFMWLLDVLADQRGRIYFRYRLDSEVYHAGVFEKDPIKHNGEILEGCKVFRTHTAYMPGAFVHYPKNNEILYILDGEKHAGWRDDPLMNAGRIFELPELKDVGLPTGFYGFKNLENCTVYQVENSSFAGVEFWDDPINYTYLALKDNNTGKYIIEQMEYRFFEGSRINYTLISHRQYNITGLPADIDYIYLPNSYSEYSAYAVKGNQLYYINLTDEWPNSGETANVQAELYFTAESNITVISTENTYRNEPLIGTEDGYVYMLDTYGAKNKIESKLESKKKILFEHKVDAKVKDVKWRWLTDLNNFK